MKEVFYTKDNTKNEMLVTVVYTDWRYNLTTGHLHDSVMVDYNGESYTLLWNPVFSYYEGKVDELDGFMV